MFGFDTSTLIIIGALLVCGLVAFVVDQIQQTNDRRFK